MPAKKNEKVSKINFLGTEIAAQAKIMPTNRKMKNFLKNKKIIKNFKILRKEISWLVGWSWLVGEN